MTFYDYLLEKGCFNFIFERVNFAKGKDFDYPAENDTSIVVFSEEAYKKYKLEGKTHGLNSHAIKHLGEFDPNFLGQVLASCRNFIGEMLEQDKEIDFRYYKSPTQYIKKKPKQLLKKIPDGALLNTFDLINDMKLTNQKMNDMEKKMLKYINQIGQKYETLIERKIKNAIDLNKMSYEEIKKTFERKGVFTFDAEDKGIVKTFYFDTRDNSIIISTPDMVRTMYHADDNLVQHIIRKFGRYKFDNYNVVKVLKDIKTL